MVGGPQAFLADVLDSEKCQDAHAVLAQTVPLSRGPSPALLDPFRRERGKQSNCQEANVDIPHPLVRIHLRIASMRRLHVPWLSAHTFPSSSHRAPLSQSSTTLSFLRLRPRGDPA